jgi:hypothetical protein
MMALVDGSVEAIGGAEIRVLRPLAGQAAVFDVAAVGQDAADGQRHRPDIDGDPPTATMIEAKPTMFDRAWLTDRASRDSDETVRRWCAGLERAASKEALDLAGPGRYAAGHPEGMAVPL